MIIIENKLKTIKVRVSEQEKEIIKKNATISNMDISKYVRLAAIKNQPIIVKDFGELEGVEDAIRDTNYNIKKIGNNINQIAHILNDDGEVTKEMVNVILKDLKEIKDEVVKIERIAYKVYDF